MNVNNRQSPLLLGFIGFSLLLHLLVLLLLPQRDLFPDPVRREPVVVEVRPPPVLPRERELDLPVRPELERPRETPARRLGPADQIVDKETAPSGDAPEDRRPDAPVPPAAAPKPAQTAPPRPERRPQAEASAREARPAPRPSPARPAETGPRPSPEAAEPASRPAPPAPPTAAVPDLQALLQLPQTTVARLENEWRQKYRPEVEKGTAVWLDTEKDLLISFFQRFRNNIYGVWNYPVRARDRGEEGTCLLRVTIHRDGTVREVKVMEGSGSSILDEEAVAAVRKGSPYGALPRAYEEEFLTIFAFFDYRLTRRIIY